MRKSLRRVNGKVSKSLLILNDKGVIMGVEIETIGLDIDGTKIILDKNAAKELYFKLKELFDSKNPTYIPYPMYPDPMYPVYPYIAPYWTNTTAALNTVITTGNVPNGYSGAKLTLSNGYSSGAELTLS
jgi:hypothetical protein